MDNKNVYISIGLIIVIILAIWLIFFRNGSTGIPNTGLDNTAGLTATSTTSGYPQATGPMAVTEYVKQNIAALAPEQAASGSSWQVLGIQANDTTGTGVVTYGDGLSSFTADFTYTMDANGVPTVTAFIVRSKG